MDKNFSKAIGTLGVCTFGSVLAYTHYPMWFIGLMVFFSIGTIWYHDQK